MSFGRQQQTVPAAEKGARAFNWVLKAFGERLSSKELAHQAFREGRIFLGGAAIDATHVLQKGDVLELLYLSE